jgi:putative hydrolase of the HAD superfamily
MVVATRAVIFDLDDTLVVEEQVAKDSLRQAVSGLAGVGSRYSEDRVLAALRERWSSGPFHAVCLELGIASWEGLWSSFEGNHPVLDGVRAWVPTYRAEAWQAVTALFDLADPQVPDLAAHRFEQAQRRRHPLVEGAAQCVQALRPSHRVGLLTNGPSDIQRRKLVDVGLTDSFDAVVISGEVGVGKPDKGIFDDALGRLGVAPGDAVMVGDNWDRDIVGALTAGLAGVWIAAGRTPPGGHERVAVIEHLGELGTALAGHPGPA